MEKITAMRTAKELAFKAYCEGLMDGMISKFEDLSPDDQAKAENRFENWWSEHYVRAEHKDGFNSEHFVMIDRSVYIKAE